MTWLRASCFRRCWCRSGIAYAVASGVPAINGLYATIIPLLAYALFGPSRILVLGPDSSLAPIILGVVLPLAAGDPGRAVTIAAAMAIVAGAVCIVAGVARLGFITELLSKPIRYGYMNGIALAVLISQLPKLFGFSIESAGPLRDLWAIGTNLADGKANWAAAALGGGDARPHPRPQGAQKDGRHPARGHRSDGGRGMARPVRALRSEGSGAGASGTSRIRPALAAGKRHRPDPARRLRRGHRRLRRYERVVTDLRGADRNARGPEPGNGGPGRSQPCRRLLPGIPDQQQLVTNAGSRGGGLENANDRRRRRAGRRAGDRRRADAVQGPPLLGARGRGHRRGDRPVRISRSRANLPHPELGVLVVHRLHGGSRSVRSDSGDRHRHRAGRHRIPLGWVAPSLGGAGQARRRGRLS